MDVGDPQQRLGLATKLQAGAEHEHNGKIYGVK